MATAAQALAMAAMSALLASCGQKGPLLLPKPAASTAVPATIPVVPAASPASAPVPR